MPSIPLIWNLPLHIDSGDGARLVELFPRVWSRIPAVGRQNLLLAWVEAGPRAMILMRDDLTDGGAGPEDMAACSADGLVIAFRSDAFDGLTDDLACAMICHEVVHATFNLASQYISEGEVDKHVEEMGWPMRRLRREVRR